MKTKTPLLAIPLAFVTLLWGCGDLTSGPADEDVGVSLAKSGKGKSTTVTVDFLEPGPNDTDEYNIRSAPQGGVQRSETSDDVTLEKELFELTLAFSEQDFADMQDPSIPGYDSECERVYQWLYRLQTEVQPPNGALTGAFEFYIRNVRNYGTTGSLYFYVDDPFEEGNRFRYLIRISSGGGLYHGSFEANGTTFTASDAGINILKLTQSRGRALESYSCLMDLADYVMTAG